MTRCSVDGQGVTCEVNANIGTLESCDGVDNDCDGSIDEDYPELNEICTEGVGSCKRRGLNVCAVDGTLVCSVTAADPTEESCDGADNDCDGSVDEEFSTLGQICTAGEGVCRQSSVTVCSEDGSGVNAILTCKKVPPSAVMA